MEALWDLARYPGLSCYLVERALDEHLNVLSETPNKEQMRKLYVLRCIEDLKKGNQVSLLSVIGCSNLEVDYMNCIYSIVKGTGTYHKPDKAALSVFY